MQRGFSLVELSIVLVILGLLTGGILAGQSLIRASELRTMATDAQRYTTAMQTFRDKYFALPGDFREATKFWNLQIAGSGCTSNHGLSTAGSPGACDGNGNGLVIPLGATGDASENFQFWRHLALAGLVEGTYTGVNDLNYAACVPGSNCPRLRIGNNGSTVPLYFTSAGNGTNGWWGPNTMGTGNWLGMGRATTGVAYPMAGIISPEEAWNLDTKMDDGKPGMGNVMNIGCTAYSTGCMVDNTGAVSTTNCNAFAPVAQYLLTNTDKTCALLFKLS